MKKTIKVATLISTDIRSRVNADLIRRELDVVGSPFVDIDMGGVVFISRSFADELLEIAEKTAGKHISITNSAGEVRSMLDVVAGSRKEERVYPDTDAKVVKLKDMDSLSKFFATI